MVKEKLITPIIQANTNKPSIKNTDLPGSNLLDEVSEQQNIN